MGRWLLLGTLCFATGFGQAAVADDAPKVTYEEHVKPILREHCFSCHNRDDATNDLALDSYARVMEGGAGGKIIEPGDADASRLYRLMAHLEGPEMPPEQDKLSDELLSVIAAWIAGGVLENDSSKPVMSNKPKVDLTVSAGSSRPEGPPPMPEGLPLRAAVYTDRASAVTALASSPWAPLVAVAGQQQILLYNSDTARMIGVLPFPEGMAHVLKFSRSGALLLAGGGHGAAAGKVVVFDVRTGERVFEIGDELDTVLAADINEDHTRIALGGPSRVVRIYSTADGSVLNEIRKHTEWIYALEFSPDGVLLATADRNGGMFVWEAETAREYQELKGHGAAIHDVSWRLDSNVLASVSEDGTARLWEMEGGKQIKSWNAHGGGALSVEFTHDGRLVTGGRDRIAKVWAGDGTEQRALEAMPELVMEVTFTHDGGRVVAGDWSGEVRMWAAADGAQVASLPANPPTLETVVATRSADAQAAVSARDQAAADLAAAEEQLAAAVANAQQVAATAQSAAGVAQEATGEQQAVQKSVTELEGIVAAANDALAAAKAALDKAQASLGGAQATLAEKAAAAEAATQSAAAAQAALDAANGKKAELEQLVAQKRAAVDAASQNAAMAEAAVQAAQAELETQQAPSADASTADGEASPTG